jgi:hypothetical protein
VATNTLRVFDGERRGKTLHFGAGKTRDAFVDNWSKLNEFMAWPVRLDEAATFDVSVWYDAAAESSGNRYVVQVGTENLTGSVEPGQQFWTHLGRMQLKPGAFEVRVMPTEIHGGELMRLRSVVLTAVKAQSAK